MIYTGDNITGEEVCRLGMANYCVPESDIDEFTEIFAKRVALIPWQMSTLRKRSFQKAYELMGVKIALEMCALMQEEFGQIDRIKKMGELMRQVPLREYFTIRDGPYNDYRTAEQAILDRVKREGEEWKGVSEETKPKT